MEHFGWGDEYDYAELPDGLPPTGMQEFAGKLYVFTKEHVYILRRIPRWQAWLRRLGRKLRLL